MSIGKRIKSYPSSKGHIFFVVQVAWEDKARYETIQERKGLLEPVVIRLIRFEFKQQSSSLWRKRVRVHESKPHLDLNFTESY